MILRLIYSILLIISLCSHSNGQERARDLGLNIGIFEPGKFNAITDVPGVSVGHVTKIQDDHIRTGVTAIIPHEGNLFQEKVPAAIYIANGFGKLAGYSQVKELGQLETPIILTNTLSVATAINALITYTLDQDENKNVRSVNAVVGETNDGRLNDIRGRHISEQDVLKAIEIASSDNVQEGNVGAGTGTICFGYKGGIGTSSRLLPESLGGYTIGVLVQSNFGGVLEINGLHVGKELGNIPFKKHLEKSDGSCMIVIITDAPVDARNLERLAKRGMMGIAKTGGNASNGSGDYIIALSNYKGNLESYQSRNSTQKHEVLRNNNMTPLFQATIEAVEEAIINSLIAAEDMTGNGYTIKALPLSELKLLIDKKKN